MKTLLFVLALVGITACNPVDCELNSHQPECDEGDETEEVPVEIARSFAYGDAAWGVAYGSLTATMPTAVVGNNFITSVDPLWNGVEGGLAYWHTQNPTGTSATYTQDRVDSFVSRSLGGVWSCAAPVGTTIKCRVGIERAIIFSCPSVRYTKPSYYVLNNGGTLYYDYDAKYWSQSQPSTTAQRIQAGTWDDGSTALWCYYAGRRTIIVSKR